MGAAEGRLCRLGFEAADARFGPVALGGLAAGRGEAAVAGRDGQHLPVQATGFDGPPRLKDARVSRTSDR